MALPAHGTLGSGDHASGTVVYTPQAGYRGTDSFTFAAFDGTSSSTAATATITIAPPAPPSAATRQAPAVITRRRRRSSRA